MKVLDPLWNVLEHQGRSDVWLAKRIGYSVQQVRFVKYGRTNPTVRFRKACSEALDLPEKVLFVERESTVAG